MIHPTAIIAPGAVLHETVKVGPYAIIDAHVTLGPGCVVGPHVHVTGHTTIGSNNRFHTGAVIGDAPQDVKYADAPTRLLIGDNNLFREHATVHRSSKLDEDTVVGSGNFFMAHSHAGHNCRIGDGNIFANGALLGGHVILADKAFISGNCLVHQFVRIGRHALMQGGSAISKDLPPFTIARGDNGICGLNIIGLRRAGFGPETRLRLKQLYHQLFRSGKSTRKVAEALLAKEPASTPGHELLEFIVQARRGVCVDHGASAADADNGHHYG